MDRNDDVPSVHLYEDDEPGRRPRKPQSNGLALAALLLGFGSFCSGLLLGIPAVVLGILVLPRAKATGKGKGMAITGIVLGGIGTIAVTALLPYILVKAVHKVREAASRTHDVNNLKQIGIATLAYIDNHQRYPGPFALNEQGIPNRGLSWRVSLLPFIDEDPLYKQFKLRSAWDNAANRSASGTSVDTYLSENDPEDNQTRYRAFVGKGALFDDSPGSIKGVTMNSITDGTSQTLLAVETADRVPWASPKDIPYTPGGPLPNLGNPSRDVVLIVLADGSVRIMKKPIKDGLLHALISRSGKEPVSKDWDQ